MVLAMPEASSRSSASSPSPVAGSGSVSARSEQTAPQGSRPAKRSPEGRPHPVVAHARDGNEAIDRRGRQRRGPGAPPGGHRRLRRPERYSLKRSSFHGSASLL